MKKIEELEKLIKKKYEADSMDSYQEYVDHLFYEAALKLIEEIKQEIISLELTEYIRGLDHEKN